MPEVDAILFDAYGTLFDTRSAVDRLSGRLEGKADKVAALWRQKQLEYTWTLSLRRAYRPFDALVREALDYALAMEGLSDSGLASDLMAGFAKLSPFADAAATLRHLKASGLRLGILSNGTPAMLQDLVEGQPFADDLDPLLSVEAAGIFKPDARVYRLGVDGLKLDAGRVGFVSGNAWDAAGAAAFGFRTFWINRSGQPVEYGLAERATKISSLGDLTRLLP